MELSGQQESSNEICTLHISTQTPVDQDGDLLKYQESSWQFSLRFKPFFKELYLVITIIIKCSDGGFFSMSGHGQKHFQNKSWVDQNK